MSGIGFTSCTEGSSRRKVMFLAVGSTNPVKIQAVTLAAVQTWPTAQVTGYEVPSGVSAQPWGDDETREGARTRASLALQAALHAQKLTSISMSDTILGIGLEGGVFQKGNELWTTVWVAVSDTTGAFYESNGARFIIPPLIAEKIQAGGEMGPVMSELVNKENVKQTMGMIGIVTNNFVDRTEEYAGIAKLSLGLWYGRSWQELVR